MTPLGDTTSPCTVMRVLKYSAVGSCVVNVSVVVVCFVTGQWIFGSTMCQVFGFTSHVAVGGTVWLIALACLERYYKLLLPAEHQGVFSEINFKIIAFGIFFLVAVILANPLYGWGEFSDLRDVSEANCI
ncbi:tyramine receptor tyra-2-like [Gigantopelta aegis]|uniref:tyramine receptor tyra-2-like n=1 Tax=Gigantopelta aegis TaxID=1735272 RepID=UPI001B88DC53|nr:tyramine receptor tyra-2-like [Gigantopelta aegis]